MDINSPFMNSTTFQHMIEDMVRDSDMNYLEALLTFCEENGIEFEDVKKLLTVNLKDKVKLAAMDEGYMRAESKLPI